MKKQTGLTKTILVIIVVSISLAFSVISIIYINSNSLQDNSSAQISDISTSATDAQIIITETGFFPQTLAVSKNQAVTWVNKDTKSHEINFSSRSLLGQSVFNSIIGPNESFSFSFEQEELVMYRATINGQQVTGQIIIK